VKPGLPDLPRAWTPLRAALLLVAVVSTGIGFVGLFVPGLPTTVFILIAAWAASRSSPRFHAWLEAHRLFGTLLRNWRLHGSVSLAAKWIATFAMSICAIILFVTSDVRWLAPTATAVMGMVLIWLWLRPRPPAGNAAANWEKEI
jgi:uncharacterized protein